MKRVAAERIPEGSDLACSFCGREEVQVRKLIAGDAATICERCLVRAIDVLIGHATETRTSDLQRFRTGQLTCSFCHEGSEHHNAMVGSLDARVCDTCLSRILLAIAADLREREVESVVLVMERD
jgi:ATP-dependent protease Clp ATPase subunit